jgi:hypothetical protein|tara:strand:- start:16822 stop:18276 length:1455 start_codon:yes stop_codon:yes gene_type:complete
MASVKDDSFIIEFEKFYQGYSQMAAFNSLTEHGGGGQASVMTNMDVLAADYMTQGPGLSTLTNGDQDGAVDELINYILDKAVSDDKTYGIGPTKLFEISAASVANAGDFPRTITGATDGSSVALLKGKLYYFFNKSSNADIGQFDLSSTFDDNWGSTVPTGAAALQDAPHPVATKEDLMVFGNGRYVGTYTDATTTLAPSKLDFGNDAIVADVAFQGNQWIIAVNSGVSGTNKNSSNIFLWGADATSSILDDETGAGPQKIGFIYPIDGTIFVAYQDLTTTSGFKIGFVNGRKITALGYYAGALPTFAQKTMFRDTILFFAAGLTYSAGAMVESLPLQLSQIADGGYATGGAIAAPFGTPMVASTDGGSNHKLANFANYGVNCTWKSIVVPTLRGRERGYIDEIIVVTNALGAGASCALTVEYNQGVSSSTNTMTIATTGKTRHKFTPGIGDVEDFRVALDFSGGSTTNPVKIRKIIVLGNYRE